MSEAPPRKAKKKKHAPTAAAGGGHWWGDPWGGLNAPNLPATVIPFLRFLWGVRGAFLGKKGSPLSLLPPTKRGKNTPQPRRPVAAIGGATQGAG